MNNVGEKLDNSLKLLIREDIDLARTRVDSDGDQCFYLSEKAYNLKTEVCRNEDILRFSQYFFEQEGVSPTRENLIIVYIDFVVMCIMEQTNIKGYLRKYNIKNVDEEDIFRTLVSFFLLDASKEGVIDFRKIK